jgi:hypothetical protein
MFTFKSVDIDEGNSEIEVFYSGHFIGSAVSAKADDEWTTNNVLAALTDIRNDLALAIKQVKAGRIPIAPDRSGDNSLPF